MDFYICLASLLCKELRATFLCSHLGAEHIGCATALTDYCPKLWRPCLPAGGYACQQQLSFSFQNAKFAFDEDRTQTRVIAAVAAICHFCNI